MVVEQYTGGSECDLRVSGGELRQTEVRMKCAADGADRIVSVQEVATCKYRSVCTHPRTDTLGKTWCLARAILSDTAC